MVCRMKTTIDLPDELLIAAKKRAAELRRPLRRLVEDGLRAQLAQKEPPRQRKTRRIRWITVPGRLPEDLDLASRESTVEWLGKHS